MSSVKIRVEDVVKDELGLEILPLQPNGNLASLGADSLDGFNILIGLEEEFHFELNGKSLPDDLFNLNDTLITVVEKIEALLKN